MTAPSPGRIVHFNAGENPCVPALVTEVVDGNVCIVAFQRLGLTFLPGVQEDYPSRASTPGTWHWPEREPEPEPEPEDDSSDG